MAKATRVLSTPPTNTPVDTTRRRFLAVAAFASVAGAGSLAAVAMTPNDVQPAVAVPNGSPNHRLRAAIRQLAAAHETLIAAQATNEEAEAMWLDWEAQNPEPVSKRGRRRWIRRADVERHAMVAKPWQDLMTAEGVFVAAQDAVAETPIAGPADVQAMAGAAVVYDARCCSPAATRRRSPALSREHISGLVRRCCHDRRTRANHSVCRLPPKVRKADRVSKPASRRQSSVRGKRIDNLQKSAPSAAAPRQLAEGRFDPELLARIVRNVWGDFPRSKSQHTRRRSSSPTQSG
jgi:hypothetical protein